MNGASPANNFVTTDDGLRLYFEVWGEGGDALLFPNGVPMRRDFERLASGRRIIAYDPRHRGQSETVTDPDKLARGILNDVDDLDAVRRHFGLEKIGLMGHSYIGMLLGLYAMQFPERVTRVIQIGPVPPHSETKYPPHLAYTDNVMPEIFAKIGALQQQPSADPVEMCRKFWEILRALYVTKPEDAARLDWARCHLTNERDVMIYWTQCLAPSLARLRFTTEDFAKATVPVLIIHGTKDRSAAYGGGREWALRLPNARLLTVSNAGHVPWIEQPELVYGAIETFLSGAWPEAAEKITVLDPEA